MARSLNADAEFFVPASHFLPPPPLLLPQPLPFGPPDFPVYFVVQDTAAYIYSVSPSIELPYPTTTDIISNAMESLSFMEQNPACTQMAGLLPLQYPSCGLQNSDQKPPVDLNAPEPEKTKVEGEPGVVACRGRRSTNGVWKHDDVVVRKKHWIPKFRRQRKPLVASEEFYVKDCVDNDDMRTTIMIKNLPNKLMKKVLMDLLDEHCIMENRKVRDEGTAEDLSEYDFFYLPMDFDSGSNLGYAFVNFTRPVAARRLHRAFHNSGWEDLLGSRKIREVTYARIQGLAALKRRFVNSIFVCDSDDYLPVYFTPSRDGDRKSRQHHVGQRVA